MCTVRLEYLFIQFSLTPGLPLLGNQTFEGNTDLDDEGDVGFGMRN